MRRTVRSLILLLLLLCLSVSVFAADTAQARLLHQMIERVMEIACPEEDAHHGA